MPLSRSSPSEIEQPGRVGGMEPGRRLVEDVEDAPEAASGLGGQPDALDLAAGERVRGPVEAQVAEAEAFEQVRSFQQRLAHGLSGGPAGRVESQVADLGGQAAEAHRAEIGDRPAGHGHPEGFGPEPPAAAGAAGERPGEAEDVVVPLRLEDGLHDRQDALVEPFLARLGHDALPAEPRFERVLAVADEDACRCRRGRCRAGRRSGRARGCRPRSRGPGRPRPGPPWSPGNR